MPRNHGSPQARAPKRDPSRLGTPTRRGELEARATVLAEFKRGHPNGNKNAMPTGGGRLRGQGWGLDALGNAPSPKRLWCVGDWLRRVVHAAGEWPGRVAFGDRADF